MRDSNGEGVSSTLNYDADIDSADECMFEDDGAAAAAPDTPPAYVAPPPALAPQQTLQHAELALLPLGEILGGDLPGSNDGGMMPPQQHLPGGNEDPNDTAEVWITFNTGSSEITRFKVAVGDFLSVCNTEPKRRTESERDRVKTYRAQLAGKSNVGVLKLSTSAMAKELRLARISDSDATLLDTFYASKNAWRNMDVKFGFEPNTFQNLGITKGQAFFVGPLAVGGCIPPVPDSFSHAAATDDFYNNPKKNQSVRTKNFCMYKHGSITKVRVVSTDGSVQELTGNDVLGSSHGLDKGTVLAFISDLCVKETEEGSFALSAFCRHCKADYEATEANARGSWCAPEARMFSVLCCVECF